MGGSLDWLFGIRIRNVKCSESSFEHAELRMHDLDIDSLRTEQMHSIYRCECSTVRCQGIEKMQPKQTDAAAERSVVRADDRPQFEGVAMNLATSTESRNAAEARTVRTIAKVSAVGGKPGTAANETLARVNFVESLAANRGDASYVAIDPVLLIHSERAETFRLLAQWVRQGF